jgi:hypothetical protein
MQPFREVDGLAARDGLARDLPSRLRFEQRADSAANDGVIVDDDDA